MVSTHVVESYEDIVAVYDPSKNTTRNMMSKYEKAKIVGMRLQQVAAGATTLVDTKGMKTIREIVDAELEQKKLPFMIVRTMPTGIKEFWKVKDMIIPPSN
jgi:DNA-directed RNA polymerase I, II, and III subunit RPABC2